MTNLERVLLASVAIGIGTTALPAQSRDPSVRTLEPQLTRLYGSDSLNLWHPMSQARLSPDGRWVAFNTVEGADRTNLWIASVEDGRALRLTNGPEFSGQPRWFPSGDRIAFRSSRFAREGSDDLHIVSLAIDPETGRPHGAPRQITLEATVGNGYAISPDGKRIAYTASRRAVGPPLARVRGLAVKVLPTNGGTARTVVEREALFDPSWAPDGRSLYVLTREDVSVEYGPDSTATAVLMRIWLDDGRTDVVHTWPRTEVSLVKVSPDGQYVYRQLSEGEYELSTIGGRTLGRFRLPDHMALGGFAAGNGALIALRQNTVAPLRVVPVAGGPVKQLNDARTYDWPLGWTADSKQVLFSTQLNGDKIMLLAPVDGGPMRQIRRPDKEMARGWEPALSDDGRHMFYAVPGGDHRRPAAKILDIETGHVREVSHALWNEYVRYNVVDGGTDFLYAEERGNRIELRSIEPTGASRLLGAFSPGDFPNGFAAHGDRIAFTRRLGNEMSLYLKVAGDQRIRKVFTHPGQIADDGMWRPEWSPDGSMLALSYAEKAGEPGLYERFDVMLVRLTADGKLVGEPRILKLDPGPRWWYGLQWLPDGSGFLVLGMGAERSGIDSDVWLVSIDPDVKPVAVTADDPHAVWGFALSPDGKYVAYSSEMPLGGSIWKIEFDGVSRER